MHTVYFSAITQTLYTYNGTGTPNLNSTGWEETDSYHVAAVKTYNQGEVITESVDKVYSVSGTVSDLSHKLNNTNSTESVLGNQYIYVQKSGSDYNIIATLENNSSYSAQTAYNTYGSNLYRAIVSGVNKTTRVTYSNASGKMLTSGKQSVTKTCVVRQGDDYIIEVVTERTEQSKTYSNLMVTKTETVSYSLAGCTVSQATRTQQWWGSSYSYSWSNVTEANVTSTVTDYLLSNNGFVDSSTSADEAITVDQLSSQPTVNGTPKKETTYEMVQNVRRAENIETQIISLSQMFYNNDGTVGTIIYDGENYDVYNENGVVIEKHRPYLEFYGENPLVAGQDIQTLFLSVCYSKDYPVAVRVNYRQIQ